VTEAQRSLDLSILERQVTADRRAGSSQRQLRRDATPLIDLLPEAWRSRIP